MNLTAIILRSLLAYLFLLALLRISGKRSIYHGTPLDFITALILGDLVDDLVLAEVPSVYFFVAGGSIALTHVGMNLAVLHSKWAEQLFVGPPVTLVNNGQWHAPGLRRERLNRSDAMALMRLRKLRDLREVHRATLEMSGEPCVLKKPWAKEADRRDLETVRRLIQ